jgi:hypothetical protein
LKKKKKSVLVAQKTKLLPVFLCKRKKNVAPFCLFDISDSRLLLLADVRPDGDGSSLQLRRRETELEERHHDDI